MLGTCYLEASRGVRRWTESADSDEHWQLSVSTRRAGGARGSGFTERGSALGLVVRMSLAAVAGRKRTLAGAEDISR